MFKAQKQRKQQLNTVYAVKKSNAYSFVVSSFSVCNPLATPCGTNSSNLYFSKVVRGTQFTERVIISERLSILSPWCSLQSYPYIRLLHREDESDLTNIFVH